MLKNRQSTRSLIAFIVTWAFGILTITGLVLYVIPQGRVAFWTHWSLLGLSKEQWGDVHMMFGGVFIIAAIVHLYYNWKPFKKFLAERVKGRLQIKQEFVIAMVFSFVIVIMSVLHIPPVSWVFDLNETLKDSWVTSPELEPPFGHAEEVSLAGISRRMGLDLDKSVAALERKGFRFNGPQDSLEKIATANGTTPMAVYEVIRPYEMQTEPVPVSGMTIEEVENRYAGTGLGRKTLADVCEKIDLAVTHCVERLSAKGYQVGMEEKLKEAAERYEINPIDVLKMLLVKEYKPEN
jgi:hypothetical protein